MSLVPYTTQADQKWTPEGSDPSLTIFMIFTNNETDRQRKLMIECQDCLTRDFPTAVLNRDEILNLPNTAKFFVVSTIKENLKQDSVVKDIRYINPKACIYTPRLMIEARSYRKISPPKKLIARSLSMNHCNVFIAQGCGDMSEIIRKIYEMSGRVVVQFVNPCINVVISHRSDDKHCLKARRKDIVCVTPSWVTEHYKNSLREDETSFDVNALKDTSNYRVGAFFGLTFKILVRHQESYIKNLLKENQGHVLYTTGRATHEVVEQFDPANYPTPPQKTDGAKEKPDNNFTQVTISEDKPTKRVDIMFIETCAKLGYYLTNKEYKEYMDKRTDVKMEPVEIHEALTDNAHSQSRGHRTISSLDIDECFTPPIPPTSTLRSHISYGTHLANIYSRSQAPPQQSHSNENQSMFPPPSIPRQPRTQNQQQTQNNYPDNVNEVILKALSGFENGAAQTQLASTQMRGLPERAIQIEQTMEPSQQLYWSDTVSRRN